MDNGTWELDWVSGSPKVYNSCFDSSVRTERDLNEEMFFEVCIDLSTFSLWNKLLYTISTKKDSLSKN